MATQYTARLSLPYPELTDTADVPRDFEALAALLDDIVGTDDQGPVASRPTSTSGSPGKRGRYYFATDEGILYRDRGTQWDAIAQVGADTSNPVGQVITYMGNTAPSGWLLCDGSRYANSAYSALATVIGSRFTLDGDPAGTFRVPDLRGRGVIGAGTGTGLTARTLGASGGSETHTLTSGQLPGHTHAGTTATEGAHTHTGTTATEGAHTHSGSTGNDTPDHAHSGSTGGQSADHTHGVTDVYRNAASGSGAAYASPSYFPFGGWGQFTSGTSNDHTHSFTSGGASARHQHSFTTGAGSAHSHTFTTGAGSSHSHTFTTDSGTGAGQAHNNMAPFLVANYLIRT